MPDEEIDKGIEVAPQSDMSPLKEKEEPKIDSLESSRPNRRRVNGFRAVLAGLVAFTATAGGIAALNRGDNELPEGAHVTKVGDPDSKKNQNEKISNPSEVEIDIPEATPKSTHKDEIDNN